MEDNPIRERALDDRIANKPKTNRPVNWTCPLPWTPEAHIADFRRRLEGRTFTAKECERICQLLMSMCIIVRTRCKSNDV